MRYTLDELATLPIAGKFEIGSDVTIKVYNALTQAELPTNDDVCVDTNGNGFFYWNFSNLTTQPTAFTRLHWVMTDGDVEQSEIVDAGGWSDLVVTPKTYLLIPFDVDIEKIAINKGDSWEPYFRVDSDDPLIKVSVELSDMGTPDYDQTVINKYTSNIVGGGDDQVLRIALTDTFQFFRIFLSGDETVLFGSKYVDMKITIENSGGQISTVKKKIPFTQTSAITFDSA